MDIALIPNQGDLSFDIALDGADLATDSGLRTAIIISLFTDARAADDDDLPQKDSDRRGWWGDAYADVPGDQIGSKLWLLSRSKNTAATLQKAQEYANAALAWLVEDGVAISVTCVASAPERGVLGVAVTIERPNGPARDHFDFVWRAP